MQNQQRGFTLVEMTVVLAIFTILVMLFLPGVTSMRQQARGFQCKRNLSQIGLALRAYDSLHTVLPPGVVNHNGPIRSIEDAKQMHISWISMILPQLGERNWYAQQDFSTSVYDAKHDDLRAVPFPILTCPIVGPSRFDSLEMSAYAGVHHHQEASIDSNNSGVLFLNSSVDMDELLDGAGNTMLVAEKDLPVDDLGWISGTRSTMRNTGCPITNVVFDYSVEVDWNQKDRSTASPREALKVGGFQSEHIDGLNALFCDGRVVFLSVKLDQTVYERMGNRHDGELIGDF